MVGSTSGRFSYKMDRELIALAREGASVSQIAAHFGTTAATIQRKAKLLRVSVRPDDTHIKIRRAK